MDTTNESVKLNANLSIDEVCKIRVLDTSTTAKTEKLQNECIDFVESEFMHFVFNFKLTLIYTMFCKVLTISNRLSMDSWQ